MKTRDIEKGAARGIKKKGEWDETTRPEKEGMTVAVSEKSI